LSRVLVRLQYPAKRLDSNEFVGGKGEDEGMICKLMFFLKWIAEERGDGREKNGIERVLC
jgi:hypothetical protein